MGRTGPSASRDLAFVSVLVGGTNFGTAVAIPVLPLHANALGASVSTVGLVIAMFGLGRLLSNLPAGHLVERLPVKVLLVTAGLVAATASALVAVGGGIGLLLVLRLMSGIAAGTAVTVAQTSLLFIEVASSSRALGYLLSAQFAAGALGPVVGGVVAEEVGTSAAFVVAGGVGLACSLAAAWGLSSTRAPSAELVGGRAASPGIDRRPLLAVCLAGGVVVLARYGGEHVLIPVLAYGDAGVSPRDLGLTFGIVGAANAGLVVLSSRVGERIGHRSVVVASLTTYAFLLLGFLVVHDAGAMLGLVVVAGLVTAFSATAPTAYLLDLAAGRRGGPAVGAFRTISDLSGLVGAVATGWLIERADPSAAVVTLAVLVFVVAVSFAAMTRGATVGYKEIDSALQKEG